MNENHWYPRDPQRFLTDTQWCDHATEVAHNRLTDTYYALGRPLYDNKEEISNIGKIKPEDYVRVRGNLERLGWKFSNGFLNHKRIEETMSDMEEQRQKKFKQTAAARQARQSNVTSVVTSIVTETQPQPQPQPQLKSQSQQVFIKPTIEQLEINCSKIGLPTAEASKFYHYYESNGWKIGGRTPMKSWQSAMINWRSRWQEKNQKLKSKDYAP